MMDKKAIKKIIKWGIYIFLTLFFLYVGKSSVQKYLNKKTIIIRYILKKNKVLNIIFLRGHKVT